MIPMVDLKKQYLEIKEEVLEVLNQILESSQYILGSNVRELEKKIAEFQGLADAVGVASGTDALHLALEAFGIAEGDEVITTPFTFIATAEAILYTGAKPVFVDIDDDTMNIDTENIESRITEKTKAIMPVHLFGHPADMGKIIDIAKKHNLKIIEDCAQSFGADINGKRTGSFGEAGCFSFYPSKNLGAFGDGGMIVLSNPTIADDIRRLRNHGSTGAYIHESIGFNSRLDEIQAGILLIKLKRINTYNALRKQKAALYNELLSDSIQRPLEKPGMTHVSISHRLFIIRYPCIFRRR
jgi:dTDP-4-amino-4,6-dideoxygalactose transaminase